MLLLQSGNHLHIKTIHDQIINSKQQHETNRKTVKISALSSKKMNIENIYEFRTAE